MVDHQHFVPARADEVGSAIVDEADEGAAGEIGQELRAGEGVDRLRFVFGEARGKEDGVGLWRGDVDIAELMRDFLSPPVIAKPRVWWHWMDGNITKEGIRLDLEWMHRVGIGGAQT